MDLGNPGEREQPADHRAANRLMRLERRATLLRARRFNVAKYC
jgi:hypothetical protein